MSMDDITLGAKIGGLIQEKSQEAEKYGQARAERTAKAGQAASDGPSAPQADSVRLSERARLVSQIREGVEAAPQVREEKVQALRQALAEGRYEVDADKVAGKMLGLRAEELV